MNFPLLHLLLQENCLRGCIPEEIGSLVNLKRLRLGENRLDGFIPDQLGSLLRLERLELEKNSLRGSIPDQLGSLALREIIINRNCLSHTLPEAMGSIMRIAHMDGGTNLLPGSRAKTTFYQEGESSLNIKFLGGIFLGHPGPRRRDIPDKNFMQVAFSAVLDTEWPGCPGIWVGTSRIWENFMQENFGLNFSYPILGPVFSRTIFEHLCF